MSLNFRNPENQLAFYENFGRKTSKISLETTIYSTCDALAYKLYD